LRLRQWQVQREAKAAERQTAHDAKVAQRQVANAAQAEERRAAQEAKAEEQRRIAAEKQAAADARAAERRAVQEAKAEEQRRVAAEKQAAADARAAERRAVQEAKAEEQRRIAAEKQARKEAKSADNQAAESLRGASASGGSADEGASAAIRLYRPSADVEASSDQPHAPSSTDLSAASPAPMLLADGAIPTDSDTHVEEAVREPVLVPPSGGADPHPEAEPAMVALHGREALLRDLRYLDDL
jgi:hypothetical protein